MFGYYPTFHTLTNVGRKSTFSMLKICFRFSLLFYSFAVQNIRLIMILLFIAIMMIIIIIHLFAEY